MVRDCSGQAVSAPSSGGVGVRKVDEDRQLSAVAPLLGSEGRAARVVFLASTSGRRFAGGRREKGALFRAACPAMACPSPLLVAKGQGAKGIFGRMPILFRKILHT